MFDHNVQKQNKKNPLSKENKLGTAWLSNRTYTIDTTCRVHSGQTQKPTSHPVVSALKICIGSKRLRNEVRNKALLEIQ